MDAVAMTRKTKIRIFWFGIVAGAERFKVLSRLMILEGGARVG